MNATAAIPSAPPRQVADLPCPKGLPLIGNLLQLSPPRLHLILERWAEELGAPFRFQIGAIPITVWTDTELIQSIMRERPHRYRRYRPIEAVLDEIGCNGLFSAEGDAWEPQRRLVMQALSIPNIKAFYPTLADITERLRKRWLRAAERGEVVEMTDDLKRYTVDVTSALAFGEDPRTLEQEHGAIEEHLEQILPGVMARINALFPYWRYVKLPRDRKLDHSLAEVHRYVRAMMQRARERMRDEPSPEPRNLLEAMLVQQQEPDAAISDDQIAANVLTLLLAGEDTTADSIAWTLPYLAADPQLQQRLGDEATRALGTASVCPDYATLKELDLFEAICIEATRLRPVASVHSFEPLEDVCVGGVALPRGTRMFFLARPAMIDAAHFADPQRYDPYRWLRKHERSDGDAGGAHDVRAYLQFGAGPRVCPGRHLATVEMRLVLSMLMREFTIELATDIANIREVQAFTMVPDTMPIKLKKRAG